MNPYDAFSAKFENIKRTYCRQVDFSKEYAKYMPGDLIEIHDDLQKVFPILQQVVNCEVKPKDFLKAMSKLEARLSHLVDHMNDLQSTLERLSDDDLEKVVQARKKTARTKTGRSKKKQK